MRTVTTLSLTLLILVFAVGIVGAQTELPVMNGDFEAVPPSADPADVLGKWPYGWTVSHQATASQFHIGITDELAFDGKHSLLIQVDEREGGILIESQPIPIEAGKTYALLANVYNTSSPPVHTSSPHLYIQFWDENGWWGDRDFWSEESWSEQRRGQWSTRARLHHKFEGNSAQGGWVEILVLADAPEGAKYATIGLWTVNRTMKAYVDGVRLAVVE